MIRCGAGRVESALNEYHTRIRKKKGIQMARIPKEIQEFLIGKNAWVSTASADGVPNATPKGSVRVIDDEHIVYAELFSQKTRANLQENPKVAVTVVDFESFQGYQIKGTAEMFSEGPLFDQMAEGLKAVDLPLPPLQYAVMITVDSVYDQSGGPNAGKQVA
jgi:predicted pyridoxine 5'-phosphate oxidase superfamily flavin-nucleotide-binding protein